MSTGKEPPEVDVLHDQYRSIFVDTKDQTTFRMTPEESQEFFRLRAEFMDSLSPQQQSLLLGKIMENKQPLHKEFIRDQEIIRRSGYWQVSDELSSRFNVEKEWLEYKVLDGDSKKFYLQKTKNREVRDGLRQTERMSRIERERMRLKNPYLQYLLYKWGFMDLGSASKKKSTLVTSPN